MTIERMFPSGGWRIYAIIGENLVTRRYFDYSKREAIALFRIEVKTLAGSNRPGDAAPPV